jgi:hypothetical protein
MLRTRTRVAQRPKYSSHAHGYGHVLHNQKGMDHAYPVFALMNCIVIVDTWEKVLEKMRKYRGTVLRATAYRTVSIRSSHIYSASRIERQVKHAD